MSQDAKATGVPIETQSTLDSLAVVGVSGAECLSPVQIAALGDLTLNELKALSKAQKLLPTPAAGGMCGGYIF